MLTGDDFRIHRRSFSIHLEAVPDPNDPMMKRMKRNEVGEDWKKPDKNIALTNNARASRVRLIRIRSFSLTTDHRDLPRGFSRDDCPVSSNFSAPGTETSSTS